MVHGIDFVWSNNHLLMMTPEILKQWLLEWLELNLGIPATDLNPDQPFMNYNMNSLTATMLVGDLEHALKVRLSPTLTWDYPTVHDLVRYLVHVAGTTADSGTLAT